VKSRGAYTVHVAEDQAEDKDSAARLVVEAYHRAFRNKLGKCELVMTCSAAKPVTVAGKVYTTGWAVNVREWVQ
jgi:hypothetical protein